MEASASQGGKYFLVSAFRRNKVKGNFPEEDEVLFAAPKNWSHKCLNLTYPRGEKDAVQITTAQIRRLEATAGYGAYLDDELIDFYIKYLQSKVSETVKKQFYFFNSFFFKKYYLAIQENSTRIDKSRFALGAVEKWTHSGSIFSKDYLLIPINLSLHWSLIVVYRPSEINCEGSSSTEDTACKILHLDPVRGLHDSLQEHIQNFLCDSWIKEHPAMDVTLVKEAFSRVRYVEARVPQQSNDCDCGVYVLQFVEQYMKAPEQLELISEDWFPKSDISSKRSRMRDLIYTLAS